MESKTRFLGHPIHTMLVVLPLGLLTGAVVSDIIYLINGNTVFSQISYYDIAVGVIGGLLAAVFGFTDWLFVQSSTRAKSIGLWHGVGNVTIVVLFIISWLIRNADPNHTPSTLALILSFAGILLALVTAWLGGELTTRLGVGISSGANLDAPSSLSDLPAGNRMGAPIPVTGRKEDDSDPDRSTS